MKFLKVMVLVMAEEIKVEDFLIGIEYDGSSYVANYLSGKSIELDATSYQDAVLEADTLEIGEYE